jgi:serine/threonine protein kinase
MDSFGHICLTDFGRVRSTFKETYGIYGTPEYIGRYAFFNVQAPETLKNPNNLSFCSDFWQLGIVLYEMIYSHPPFMADEIEDLFDYILNCNLVFPDKPKVSNNC